ncbi:MAG: AraC family transcriptional regulator, partial [Pseudomonadales bacterium]|nr:AraC family transcriptional regulator [Pseudomonadales bacterium]
YIQAPDGRTILLCAGELVLFPRGGFITVLDNPDTPMESAKRLDTVQLNDHSRILNIGDGGDLTLMVVGQFQYDPVVAQPLIAALPDQLELKLRENRRFSWLELGIEFVMQEIRKGEPGEYAIINRLLDILFIRMIKDFINTIPEDSDNWLRGLIDPVLSKALAVIHASPEHNWKVEQLAEISGVSRSVFSSRFTDVIGKPPLQYITQHRMRLACQLLTTTDKSLQPVAQLVGYSSEAAFSQAFKRELGVAPSDYRAQAITSNRSDLPAI